eukprot:SAG22_NODE_2400_length_2616_cov_4.016289_4_plen_101_part_00
MPTSRAKKAAAEPELDESGGRGETIPFLSRPILRPERLRLLQSEGEQVETDLWTDAEYALKYGKGYPLLDKGTQVELEYGTVVGAGSAGSCGTSLRGCVS